MNNEVDLSNKPLVEAIFELKWHLPNGDHGPAVDPHYRLLIGHLHAQLEEIYPYHEPLPTSSLPDVAAAYVVQHRFRTVEAGWPLIQLGPGVLTLNSTSEYTWTDFQKRLRRAVEAWMRSQAKDDKQKHRVKSLLLRYIDSVSFDYENDVLSFLRDKLKVNLSMDEVLFQNAPVEAKPSAIDLRLAFPVSKPSGYLDVRFARGERDNTPALIWETRVAHEGQSVPQDEAGILEWADAAHDLTHEWFFKMIEGELRREFQ